MNRNEQYVQTVNQILPAVDFKKLDHSCNSCDSSYARETLKQLHQAFVDTYGTDLLQRGEYDCVYVPAVIQGKETRNITLGMVLLDLNASGEHWGTVFFTKYGVMDQGDEKLSKPARKYLCDTIGSYHYWYTPEIPSDIHVGFENIPSKVRDILSECSGITPRQNMEGMDGHAL